MPRLLKDMRIDEISFVDAGANRGARVLLFKRADASADPDKEDFDESGDKEAAERELLGNTNDEAAGADEEEDDMDAEKLKKQVDDSVSKALEAVNKQHAEELKKRDDKIAELVEVNASRERLAKAKDALGGDEAVGQKATDVADVLKALPADKHEAYLKSLRAAREQAAASAAFTTVGVDAAGSASGGALEKMRARATEIRKADPKMTQEQAFSKAASEDPKLYDAYLAGRH